MSEAETRGRELFESGLFCAEAVLKTIAEQQGVASQLIPGVATGFCSGLARSGGPCGAMTGAVMALGLVLGRNDPERSVEQTYDAVRTMMTKFEAHLGSTNCTELLGVDLGTPEGRQAFEDRNLDSQCADITGFAAALVEEILESNEG